MPRFAMLGATALALSWPLALADEDGMMMQDDADFNSTDDLEQGQVPALPPFIEFTGRKPKVKIYPGGVRDKTATWYQLEFAEVQEIGADGRKVNERSIMSLASEADIVFTQANETVGGVLAQVTDLSLPLSKIFVQECKDGGKTGKTGKTGESMDGSMGGSMGGPMGASMGGSMRRLAGRMPDDTSAVSIKTFLFPDVATIQYGNETLEVPATSFKYNVESTNWPFCAEGNTLRVKMQVKVKGDKRPKKFEDKDLEKEEAERQRTGKRGKGVKGKKFKSSAGSLDVEMDLPTLTLVDGELQDSEVDIEVKGSKTKIAFTFPHFTQSMIYDPTGEFTAPDGSATELGDTEETTTTRVYSIPTGAPDTGNVGGDGKDGAGRSSSSPFLLAALAAMLARLPAAPWM